MQTFMSYSSRVGSSIFLLLACMPFGRACLGEDARVLLFEVDGAKQTPISPFIYGNNQAHWKAAGKLYTLGRVGGNRLTAYNWENNASNAGSDWQHQNDNIMGGGETPGESMRTAVNAALEAGAACIVTVPIAGYVAADKLGGGDVKKTPNYLAQRFRLSLPEKGSPFAYPPDLTDNKVYQDEFVWWLEKTFSNARADERRTLFYALDNEPDLWAGTHARIHPKKVEYEELATLNTAYAAAIKKVAPSALVFGFVSYGWQGFTTLQNAPDAKGRNFIDYYLQEMRKAEAAAGHRLVDVLDLHWYPEAQGGGKRITEDDASPAVAAARVQAPRSLWDPAYTEKSWIAGNLHEPIRLLPRVRQQIEKQYPGTKLALTEYYYGGGADISGALAEADALGIFGREGLFAACLWHIGRTDDRFIQAAFAMFRDYDGKGGSFGPAGLAVSGGDPAQASVYASIDEARHVVLVAINKTTAALPVKITVKGAPQFSQASLYRLTAATPKPSAGAAGEVKISAAGMLDTELPAQSVTTFILLP